MSRCYRFLLTHRKIILWGMGYVIDYFCSLFCDTLLTALSFAEIFFYKAIPLPVVTQDKQVKSISCLQVLQKNYNCQIRCHSLGLKKSNPFLRINTAHINHRSEYLCHISTNDACYAIALCMVLYITYILWEVDLFFWFNFIQVPGN